MHFPVFSRFRLHDEPLFLPVLQHLVDSIARDVGTLHADAVLEGTFKVEFYVLALVDSVVLAHALTFVAACIVATVEGILYTVTEEVQRVL